MLFNSYIFIFVFLPLALIGYFGLNKKNKYTAAKIFLVILSLVFYGYNNVKYVFVILSSIIVNYLVSILMFRCSNIKKHILGVGVIANIVLLSYFKYLDFLLENITCRLCKVELLLFHRL